jgi:hypothetical protein
MSGPPRNLGEAKAHLQSECERLEQETVRYVSRTQSALETTTIISDSNITMAPRA